MNASRAFLTIDSGFPLAALEQVAADRQPPVLARLQAVGDFRCSMARRYWTWRRRSLSADAPPFIDAFLMGDSSTARLYLGLAKLDPETSDERCASACR